MIQFHRNRQTVQELSLWLPAFAIGLIYFFLLGERGYVIYPDSYSYINAAYEREPFYPLVIMACKGLFGERFFLYAVAFLQGITAFAVSLFATGKLREYLHLCRWEAMMTYILLLLPYGLDTMWAEPRVNYTHIIVSDCFSYAFFYLFVVAMLCYLQKQKTGAYVWMLVIASVMTLNRNQMEILYVSIAIVSVIQNCIRPKKRKWKRCALEIAGIFAAVVLTMMLTLGYFYAKWGQFAKSSENNFTMITNLIYTADAQDAELFEDEKVGEVFAGLYAQADENGWTYRYAKEGFLNNGEYMIYCHDHIKSLIIRPFFEDYVSSLGMEPKSFESDQVKKAVTAEIKSVLWKAHFLDWLYDAFCVVPKGFVYSVMPVIFPGTYMLAFAGAVVVWAVFIAGLCCLLFCRRMREREENFLVFALSIACFMVMNIVALCLVIFVEYRYLNYTQGLFWLVFYLLFRNLYQAWRADRKKELQADEISGESSDTPERMRSVEKGEWMGESL